MADELASPDVFEDFEGNETNSPPDHENLEEPENEDEPKEEKTESVKFDEYSKEVFGSDDSDDEREELPNVDDDSDASDYGDTQDLELLGKGQLDKLVKEKAKAPKRKASTSEKPAKKRRKTEDPDDLDSKPAKKAPQKKPPKRKTRTEEEVLIIVEEFMDKIRNAYDADEEAFHFKKPATNKLKLLDQLQAHATHAELQEKFVEKNLLDELARWLQPDKRDKSLPNIRIREVILSIVDKIRTEYLDSNIIKDSGIGKMVYLYSVHPKETPANAKYAGQIMNKWMRNVFGSGEVPVLSRSRKPKRPEASPSTPTQRVATFGATTHEEDEDSAYRFHPKIPQSVTFEFGRSVSSNFQSERPAYATVNESSEARKQMLAKSLSQLKKKR